MTNTGLSGVDAITPAEIDVLTSPFSVIAAQAVADQVQFLRRPLGPSSNLVFLEKFIILGAGSSKTIRIAEVGEHLGRFCGHTAILAGLPPEAEAFVLALTSTFINLADIDSPFFKDVTEEKMDGLKRVFHMAKHILWITVGRPGGQTISPSQY